MLDSCCSLKWESMINLIRIFSSSFSLPCPVWVILPPFPHWGQGIWYGCGRWTSVSLSRHPWLEQCHWTWWNTRGNTLRSPVRLWDDSPSYWCSLQIRWYIHNPLLLCKGHREHVANLKACYSIYPYLHQPFTFPRFANNDRWFAVPVGTAA